MDNYQDQNIKDILETVNFIKDKAATKEGLKEFATKEDLKRFATKEDLNIVKDEIMDKVEQRIHESKDEILTKVDTFITLHNKVDTELTALRSKYDRLEQKVKKVIEHLQLEL